MVAIFAEKVMAEQAEIVRKQARTWGRVRQNRRAEQEAQVLFWDSCAICKMVVGEGLFGALRLTLRAALKRVVSRCSTRTLIEGSHPSPRRTGSSGINLGLCAT